MGGAARHAGLRLTRVGGTDGPNPLTYDRTDANGIRVVFTTQGKVLEGGLTNFSMVAYVPISANNLGQLITLDIRKYSAAGIASDVTLVSCEYEPEEGDVGRTVAFPCDMFEVVPWTPAEGTTVAFYPYVTRRGGGDTIHNGRTNRLNATMVGDDASEENDDEATAKSLGSMAAPVCC